MLQWQHLTPKLLAEALARLGGRWRWLTDRDGKRQREAKPQRRRPAAGLVRLRRPF